MDTPYVCLPTCPGLPIPDRAYCTLCQHRLSELCLCLELSAFPHSTHLSLHQQTPVDLPANSFLPHLEHQAVFSFCPHPLSLWPRRASLALFLLVYHVISRWGLFPIPSSVPGSWWVPSKCAWGWGWGIERTQRKEPRAAA